MCFNQGDENSGKISERMILGEKKVNCVYNKNKNRGKYQLGGIKGVQRFECEESYFWVMEIRLSGQKKSRKPILVHGEQIPRSVVLSIKIYRNCVLSNKLFSHKARCTGVHSY